MPHPFFDVTAYPWHRPEADGLHKALYQAIPAPQAIDLRYKKCADNLTPLPLAGNPADAIWKAALENLTAAGLLRKLCQALLEDMSVQAIHGKVRDVSEAQDVTEQSFLAEEVIFLDRKDFRTKLSKLQSGSALQRVLLVRGESGSGKSWSGRMVEHLAREDKAGYIYLCEGIVSNVDDVLQNLFTSLEAAIPARGLTTPDAWFRQVCLDLQKAAQNKKQRWWIVVDDLGMGPDGGPRIDPEIRSFFDQFALFMLNPAFAQWFRLVLIHYPEGPVPTKWKKDLWTEDQTRSADVKQSDVSEFLRRWARGKKLQLPDEEAENLANGVIAKADAAAGGGGAGGGVPSSRIQLIHEELLAVIEQLGGSLA
jgi:hypothetical protein